MQIAHLGHFLPEIQALQLLNQISPQEILQRSILVKIQDQDCHKSTQLRTCQFQKKPRDQMKNTPMFLKKYSKKRLIHPNKKQCREKTAKRLVNLTTVEKRIHYQLK